LELPCNIPKICQRKVFCKCSLDPP
jgi:hypothetical protein